MYEWYEDIIKEISRIDDSIPIYISDGWDLTRALNWVNGRSALRGGPSNPVIVDHHKYYTYVDVLLLPRCESIYCQVRSISI